MQRILYKFFEYYFSLFIRCSAAFESAFFCCNGTHINLYFFHIFGFILPATANDVRNLHTDIAKNEEEKKNNRSSSSKWASKTTSWVLSAIICLYFSWFYFLCCVSLLLLLLFCVGISKSAKSNATQCRTVWSRELNARCQWSRWRHMCSCVCVCVCAKKKNIKRNRNESRNEFSSVRSGMLAGCIDFAIILLWLCLRMCAVSLSCDFDYIFFFYFFPVVIFVLHMHATSCVSTRRCSQSSFQLLIWDNKKVNVHHRPCLCMCRVSTSCDFIQIFERLFHFHRGMHKTHYWVAAYIISFSSPSFRCNQWQMANNN